MKVLSYLEFCQLTAREKYEYVLKLGYKKLDIEDRFEIERYEVTFDTFYLNIVSQPFKPELITELFEGWLKEIHNSQELYIHWENWQIEFDENDRNNKYCIYSYYGDWYKITTLKPRTLDDFINDCQRAGIELEWKEQK
jgi:hypothetical protein